MFEKIKSAFASGREKLNGDVIRCPGCNEGFNKSIVPATFSTVTITCHKCGCQIDVTKRKIVGWKWITPIVRDIPKKKESE